MTQGPICQLTSYLAERRRKSESTFGCHNFRLSFDKVLNLFQMNRQTVSSKHFSANGTGYSTTKMRGKKWVLSCCVDLEQALQPSRRTVTVLSLCN